MLRLESDLRVREAERRQTGGHMRLITEAIARLLRRRAVISKTVGLYDQTQIGPEEVDPEPVHLLARQRYWQARRRSERDEQALELRVGEAEGVAIKQLAQPRHTALAAKRIERAPQRLRIDQSLFVRLVDRTLETDGVQLRGQIEESPDRARHRYSVTRIEILGPQGSAAMNANPGLADKARRRYGYFDLAIRLHRDLPKRSRTPVTEHRLGPRGEDRCHPPSATGQIGSPNGVDATLDPMETPSGDPMVNRRGTQAKLQELAARDYSVLLGS